MIGSTPQLRLLPSSLGTYFRIAHRDRKRAAGLISEGVGLGSGIILSATDMEGAEDLLQAADGAGIDSILDPLSVELSTTGGWVRRGVQELPWAGADIHAPELFTDRFIAAYCAEVASQAVDSGMASVLAPSHYLRTLPSPWLNVDERLAVELRHALDERGGRRVAIYYPLTLSLRAIGPDAAMMYLAGFLERIRSSGAIDAVSLRLDGFGVSDSTAPRIQRVIALARALHGLSLPILGEKMGALGLHLMAFGAIGAVESGLTIGETCDLRSYMKTPTGKGRMPAPRVYLQGLGALVSRKVARKLLQNPGVRHSLVCQNSDCCTTKEEMVRDPRRHYVYQRTQEVLSLSRIPTDERRSESLSRLKSAIEATRSVCSASGELQTHASRLRQWEMAFRQQRSADKYQKVGGGAATPRGRIHLPPRSTSADQHPTETKIIDIRSKHDRKEQ